jgi:hypothetical protein
MLWPVKTHAVVLAMLTLGCSGDPPPSMAVYVSPDELAIAEAFAAPIDGLDVRVSDDPAAALAGERAVPAIALVADLDCSECYRIERTADGAIVHGDAPLGIQYGLAHLLEAMGFRFYHPARTREPEAIALPPAGDAVYDALHEPELTMRGLHLHTLHPTEAYFAVWEPSPEHLAQALRIVDWVVKNRGNFVQWWALANIIDDPAAATATREHARAIVEYAHMRGVRVGVSVQLFDGGNLQSALSLGGDTSSSSERIRENLAALDGIGFDAIKISFGEFAAQDPDRFITTLNDAASAVHERWPDTEVTASLHVGDDLRVTYMGREQLYYFLVRYADPSIVPWVHTVMYYNLYDDAGGAYHHQDFSEHREFLLERLAAGERVAYYPENAYWVAFDNCVPSYLPVYLRSRWIDQDGLRRDAVGSALEEHATFSTGWEWGYWQNDYLVLRSNYELPVRWEDGVEEMFAPYGARGATMASSIAALGELQHEYLITARLAAYIAGRDSLLDIGRTMDIVSQPDRPSFEEIAAMDAASLDAFEADVVAPLGALADATEPLFANADAVVEGDRWLAETRDGIEIDLYRARFAHAIWSSIVLHARGEDTAASVAEAERWLEAAHEVVRRRHADLHDPEPSRVVADRLRNETLYDYGYLREADQLCFWERELILTTNLLTGVSERVPPCVL